MGFVIGRVEKSEWFDTAKYWICSCIFSFSKKFFAIEINPLPDNKILDWSKLMAFADYKSNVTQTIKVVFHRIENIVGKGENAGYQHFLLFPQCFQKAFSYSASKVVIVW